jgi:hypothetical protein
MLRSGNLTIENVFKDAKVIHLKICHNELFNTVLQHELLSSSYRLYLGLSISTIPHGVQFCEA